MDNSSEDPAGLWNRMARPTSSPSAVSRGRSTIAQSHSRPVPRPRSPAQRSMSESCDRASVTKAPRIRTSASAEGNLPVEPIFFLTKSEQTPAETERVNIADLEHKIEDLQTEIAFVSAQAEAYEEDFQQERKDRVSAHEKLFDFKDQTTAHVNRMETRIFELERENNELKQNMSFDRSKFDQLQEDYQISQSQIIAYKKQMDICKKDLENEKRKNEELISQLHNLKTELAQKRDYQHHLAPASDSFPDSEDSYEIPFDPNLICPKCGKQFRRGEIQLLRKHHESDCISSGDFVEENPLMKGLTADMESAALEVKRMCSYESSKGPRQHSRQSSGEELKLNLTKQLNNMSSELTKRTGDQALVKYFEEQIQSMKQCVNVAVERMEQGFATLRREIEQTFLKSTDKAANKTLDEHFHDLSTSPFDPNAAADLLMSRGELQDTRFTARQLHSEDVILAVMSSGQGAFRTLVEILMEKDHNRPLCRSLIATYRARGGLWMDPLLPLDHTNAMRELSRFDHSAWRMLGGSLQVPFFKLNEFASFIAGRPTGQYDALAYTMDYWLKNDLHASWDKLASAVEKCGDAVRASAIRENMGIAPTAAVPPASCRMKTPNSPTANSAKLSEMPTLDDMVFIETRDSAYPIPAMVASSYRHFAAYLLQDKDGRIVRQLETKHGGRKSDIVFDVLDQWVNGSGRERSWRTFLSGLKACGLATESDHIKHYLTH